MQEALQHCVEVLNGGIPALLDDSGNWIRRNSHPPVEFLFFSNATHLCHKVIDYRFAFSRPFAHPLRMLETEVAKHKEEYTNLANSAPTRRRLAKAFYEDGLDVTVGA